MRKTFEYMTALFTGSLITSGLATWDIDINSNVFGACQAALLLGFLAAAYLVNQGEEQVER